MDHSVIVAAVLGALAALSLIAALRHLAAWGRSRKARRRGRHAVRGEVVGERLLEHLGYSVIERQTTRSWIVKVGGESHEIKVRADLVVMRDGLRLVAEVKTGKKAPQIANASTRRQLLEYLLAYRADGLLLVEPDRRSVSEVEFPLILEGAESAAG